MPSFSLELYLLLVNKTKDLRNKINRTLKGIKNILRIFCLNLVLHFVNWEVYYRFIKIKSNRQLFFKLAIFVNNALKTVSKTKDLRHKPKA